MPRDAGPQALGEVTLGGGRKARIVETIRAGSYAARVAECWIDRLHQAGVLDVAEHRAATTLRVLFERSGVRPKLVGGAYDGAKVDAGSSVGHFLEMLSADELRCWRRCGRLLAYVPRQRRTIVSMCVCWDAEPWSIPALRAGLQALAKALSAGPSWAKTKRGGGARHFPSA